MQDEKSLLWLDTRQGADGVMELTVRILGQEAGEIPRWANGLRVHLKVQGTMEDGEYLLEKDGEVQEGGSVFRCPGVRLWDPEHPWLYETYVTLEQENTLVAQRKQKIGFRNLERKGQQLFWNHRPVKLKGICYRERGQDTEGTRRDLELFARANVNFIRGIYGPFSETFLQMCDEMGFWVENTAPFYEVGDTRPATQDLPHLKEQYLDAFRGMAALGSHTGVLIWSLGHDCVWGANFRHGADYLRRIDPVRPLTFHLPMSIPEEEAQMDIWPVHYIDWKQPFDVCFDQMVIFHTPGADNEIGYMTGQAQYQVPVLHEVWSPVACHNRDEIQHDPSIRRFWGESIRRFAEKSWQTEGCLGGAVLAGVDEDGSFEGMGKYEWGILDGEHNPKPEYGPLCQAYAPVAVKNVRRDGKKFFLEVENRFLYTDLSQCHLLVNGRKQPHGGLKCAPGAGITLNLEVPDGEKRDCVFSFVSVDGSREYGSFCYREKRETFQGSAVGEIDTKAAREVAGQTMIQAEEKADPLEILEEKDTLTVRNHGVTYLFDRESCLLTGAWVDGEQILVGGPYLNCTGLTLGSWQGSGLEARHVGEKVQVTVEGGYSGVLTVRFVLVIGQDGTLDTFFEVQKLSRHMPHVVKAQIGVSPGGLLEKGIAYLLPGECRVEVENEQGQSLRVESGAGSVGALNGWPQRGKDGGDVSAQTSASVQVCQPFANVRVEDDPSFTADAMVDDRDCRMEFVGNWYRMNDDCGNYQGTETLSRNPGDTMRLAFTGTGVRVYGPLDINYGICDICLDGKQIARADQYPDKVDLLGASRGYEKRYGQLLAQVQGLPEGEHTLEIAVSGEKAPGAQNTYTSIDYAVLEGARYPVGKQLYVNLDFNYTRLVRGCYKRPQVELVPGVREGFRMKLVSALKGSDGKSQEAGCDPVAAQMAECNRQDENWQGSDGERKEGSLV